MEQGKSQLEQQGEKPYTEKEGLQQTNESGPEIVSGANEEDQLDKLKEDAPENGRDSYPERQEGASPDTYLPPDQRA